MKELKIGRTPENDIQIEDASVSRQHAVLIIGTNEYSIRDLNSSNGTYVNGMRVNGMATLKKHDIVKVGNSLVPWMNHLQLVGEHPRTEFRSSQPTQQQQLQQSAPVQKVNLPNASGAQTCGILGLIFSLGLVGIILNIIALSLAGGALSKYRMNPEAYTEASYRKAKAGQTMGIIGLGLFGLGLVLILAANA
jgi:pSer/pThr/pTyr-binding forkhead associated (FHA) protein